MASLVAINLYKYVARDVPLMEKLVLAHMFLSPSHSSHLITIFGNICTRCGDCRLPFALTRVVGFGLGATGDCHRKCIWLWLGVCVRLYKWAWGRLVDSLDCAFCLSCGTCVCCGVGGVYCRGLIER